MINFEWTSLNLQVKRQENGLADTVVAILWAYSCTDGDYHVFETGRCQLPEPNPLDFIKFSDITKDILVSWVENLTNMSELQSRLIAKLEQKKAEDIYLVQFLTPNNV